MALRRALVAALGRVGRGYASEASAGFAAQHDFTPAPRHHPYPYPSDDQGGVGQGQGGGGLAAPRRGDAPGAPYRLTVDDYNRHLFTLSHARHNAYQARDIIDEMTLHGVPRNYVTFHTAIVGAMRAKRVQDCLAFLAQMKAAGLRPDTTVYNAVISACARAGNPARAELVLRELGAAGLRPNSRTYDALVTAYAGAGMVNEARELADKVREIGETPSPYLFASIIDALAKQRRVRHDAVAQAEAVLEEARAASPDGVADPAVYSSLIGLHTSMNDHEGALAVFNTMRAEGVEPSDATYMHVCRALLRRKGGGLEAALDAMAEGEAAGVKPRVDLLLELMNSTIANKPSEKGVAAITTVLDKVEELGYFLNSVDGSNLLYRACNRGFLGEGNELVHRLWRMMSLRRQRPRLSACGAYLSVLERTEPERTDLMAEVKAVIDFQRRTNGRRQ